MLLILPEVGPPASGGSIGQGWHQHEPSRVDGPAQRRVALDRFVPDSLASSEPTPARPAGPCSREPADRTSGRTHFAGQCPGTAAGPGRSHGVTLGDAVVP